MTIYTTEITSESITSDNPIHQRLLKAYFAALPYIKGDLLEIGCGEGRGIAILKEKVNQYTAIDKHQKIIEDLQHKYPDVELMQKIIPPLDGIKDNSFDTVVAFQVIEHIKNDKLFLQEIHRVLKPGGQAIITTPNIKMTLTRNPWHIREYTAEQLQDLSSSIFTEVNAKGITGNEKVMQYYEMNKRSVQKITRFDILNLQYGLPRFILKIPYDLLNRINRNKLQETDNSLVKQITHHDYPLSENPDKSLDLFYILQK